MFQQLPARHSREAIPAPRPAAAALGVFVFLKPPHEANAWRDRLSLQVVDDGIAAVLFANPHGFSLPDDDTHANQFSKRRWAATPNY